MSIMRANGHAGRFAAQAAAHPAGLPTLDDRNEELLAECYERLGDRNADASSRHIVKPL
jgi:hypothetical protein